MVDEKNDMSKEEMLGFHKGSLNTLIKERQELAKLLSIVEQLMQMHIKALKELGFDVEALSKEAEEKAKKDGKKIEDIV